MALAVPCTWYSNAIDSTSRRRSLSADYVTAPDRTSYASPLADRYASRAMLTLWGPQMRYGLWRRLWLALAEAH